jgi:hypothetical protein
VSAHKRHKRSGDYGKNEFCVTIDHAILHDLRLEWLNISTFEVYAPAQRKRRAFARRFVSMDCRVKPGNDSQY